MEALHYAERVPPGERVLQKHSLRKVGRGYVVLCLKIDAHAKQGIQVHATPLQ